MDGEYRALVQGCGLLDRSERGKLALTGTGAVEFLNGQVTNELTTLRSGEGRYAAFLTPKGKMLGDLRVLAVGEDPHAAPSELLLDTERVALQALFDMIRHFKVGYEVELHKRTLERGLLSLIGPDAAIIAGAGRPAARAHNPEEWAPEGRVGQLPDTEHANAIVEIDGHRRPRRAHRRRRRPHLRRCRRRRAEHRACRRAARYRSPSRPPSACASSTAGPATGSTSTTA